MIVGGMIGARFFHVFYMSRHFYFPRLWKFSKFGMAACRRLGGIVGAVVGFFVHFKRK